MGEKLNALLRSRRFWVAVSGLVVAAGPELGLTLEPDMTQQVVLLLASWIVGDSLRPTE